MVATTIKISVRTGLSTRSMKSLFFFFFFFGTLHLQNFAPLGQMMLLSVLFEVLPDRARSPPPKSFITNHLRGEEHVGASDAGLGLEETILFLWSN